MSRKKISTTIYVTPEQNDKLKLLHERTKVPVAVYIREGIDLVLRHYAHLLPGQLPLGGPPPPNLAPDFSPRPPVAPAPAASAPAPLAMPTAIQDRSANLQDRPASGSGSGGGAGRAEKAERLSASKLEALDTVDDVPSVPAERVRSQDEKAAAGSKK